MIVRPHSVHHSEDSSELHSELCSEHSSEVFSEVASEDNSAVLVWYYEVCLLQTKGFCGIM